MFSHKGIEVHWLKHAGFKIKAKDKVLYIDPFQISGDLEPADFLLISHSHFDHLEKDSLLKITQKETRVFCAQDCVNDIEDWTGARKVLALTPGQSAQADIFKITATPAYNINKPFHPKEKQWLGFLIEVDGTTIYFVGDTDPIHEIETIECDLAFFPVSGIYVMTAQEAAELANKISPTTLSVPMHWGAIVDDQNRKVGTLEDAKRFCELCKGPSQLLTPSCP